MARKRSGIREIAEASGVSPATVSQVLGSGKRPVRAETRARVEGVAVRLGYRPNAVARGLVKGRMDTLGVVIHHEVESSHTNPALAAILDGILVAATRAGQHTSLVTYSHWGEAEASLPTLTDGRCDGVLLVVPPQTNDLVPALLESGLPFVLIGAHSDHPLVSCVDIDNVAAAETIVSHLLAQGHRRIGLFCRFEETHQFMSERMDGYRRALEAAGVAFDPSLKITGAAAIDGLSLLLRRPFHERLTALFCITDADALSVMQFLNLQGIQIPEDLSLVGFDDIPLAALSFPPLTTMRQPCSAAGERATEMLLEQINGRHEAGRKLCLPTELSIRRSVAAPPPSG